ncbi:hypothetical protein SAMN06296052_102298 [Pontibacter ummariensis]|uniref:Uncharacterized protein n=1 Tax=Pontibacter ummariensis TaxID=1610492 RepID=A0A239C3D1_9BACT|nr:hypothetical protein SAMN06296052_102298 [Pontibacter ummariensis]
MNRQCKYEFPANLPPCSNWLNRIIARFFMMRVLPALFGQGKGNILVPGRASNFAAATGNNHILLPI